MNLCFLWHFKFVDPATKEVLAGQDKIPVIDERQHNSQVYLKLGPKSTISVWWAFPFKELNDKSREYIQEVTNALPFKASDKLWKLWRRSANNQWYSRTLKINAG